MNDDATGLIMEAKLEKDADSMVVKPIEYAASEYSASEAPPVSSNFIPLKNELRKIQSWM